MKNKEAVSSIFDIDKLYPHCKPLKLPKVCYQQLTNSDEPVPSKSYQQILRKYGALIVSLKYQESTQTSLEKIVNSIGRPHNHNKSGNVVWHVKPGGQSNKEELARSHNSGEFVFHTDCSYEQNVPEYIGLHCLTQDKLGGGNNLIVNCNTVIKQLSPESLHTLQNEDVEIVVPPEFRDDINSIKAKIIDKDFNVRFRSEIINEDGTTPQMKKALNEFNSLCFNPLVGKSLVLKEGQMLLLNNKRFLHSRTTIKDKNRHLLRIRFYI